MTLPSEQPPRPQALHNSRPMLRHLGSQLGWHRRTSNVNDGLERQLRALDGVQWHFERDVPICSVPTPIPFLLVGPTGVFLLQGTRGYWTDEDVSLMSRASDKFAAVIRDYPDPVRAGIILLGDDREARQHFNGSGEGPCWALGDGQLVPWLDRYQDHGFSEADIACLRDESDPSRIRELVRDFVPPGVGHVAANPEDVYHPN